MFFLLSLTGIRSEWAESDRISCSKRALCILIYLMVGNSFNRVVKLVLQHEIRSFDGSLVSVVYITDANYTELQLCIVAYVLRTLLFCFDLSARPLVKENMCGEKRTFCSQPVDLLW